MSVLKTTVLGLVLLIGLLSAGSDVGSAHGLAANSTGDPLAQVTPPVTQPDEEATLPQGASAGWWAGVQDDIGRSEYRVTWQDRTYLSDLPAAY